MKVQELIDILSLYPADAFIGIQFYSSDAISQTDIGRVLEGLDSYGYNKVIYISNKL